MAASLAVEWAKNGVRVNVLRYVAIIALLTNIERGLISSPGYMLTKLTKTILAHDQELKVSPAWLREHFLCAEPTFIRKLGNH